MANHPPVRPAPRIVTRAAMDFVLRSGQAIRRTFEGELAAGLALLALYCALDKSAKAGDASGGLLPVQSLAQSLKIPPETMRRAIGKLIARGWCRRVGRRGVAITDEALVSAQFRGLVRALRGEFRRMLADLKSIGFDFDIMDRANKSGGTIDLDERELPEAVANAEQDPNGEAFDVAIVEFLLRFAEGGIPAHDDDYMRSYVFTAIMSANAAHYTYDPQTAWRYATHESPPPDELRRPIGLPALALMVGLPYETTRRYVNKLIGIGHCVRDRKRGIIIPTSVAQAPDVLKTGVEITRRFAQTIRELKRMGFDFRGIAPSDPSNAGSAAARCGVAHYRARGP